MLKYEFNKILRKCTGKNENKKDLLRYAKRVAETGNPYFICDFCEYVEAVDDPDIMPFLQKAMENCGDIVHIYEFAFLMADCGRQCVDYKSLQDIIIASEDPKLIAYCSEYVPTFDQKALADGMIKCGNVKWLEHYIEAKGYYAGVENASEKEKISQKQRLLKSFELARKRETRFFPPKSVTDVYGILGKDLEQMRKDVLKSKNPYLINEMAENWEATLYETPLYIIEKEKQIRMPEHLRTQSYAECIEEYADAMIETGDILHIYEFGASVPGAPIRKIEDAAIEIGMAKYMYYVGAYVPGANVGRLLKSIEKTGNKKYIEKMKDHIKEAGIIVNDENGEYAV